jgi:PKD repeat protein/uncharacterized protein (DUF779 family)
MKRFVIVLFVLIVAFAFSVNGADDPKATKELTEKAESIVIGKVSAQKSGWNDNHTQIFTTVTISVDEFLKGDDKSKTKTIKIPGGKVGDIGLTVVGAPIFTTGERTLLFLGANSENPTESDILGWKKDMLPRNGKSDSDDALSIAEVRGEILKQLGKSTKKQAQMIQFPNSKELLAKAKKSRPVMGEFQEPVVEQDWGWKCVWGDNFEYDFPGTNWLLARNGNPGVNNGYTWGQTDVNPYDGKYAVWCAQTNMFPHNPDLQAGTDNYPNNTQAWMVAGPFDLSDVFSARLAFKIDQTVEPFRNVPPADNSYPGPLDRTGVGFSIDGVWFQITDQPEYQWIYNSTDGYIHYQIDIENVVGPLWDKTQVWVCFIFGSDYQVTDRGTWIDNVKIKKFVPQEMHPEIASIEPMSQSAGTGKSIKILGYNFGDFNNGNTDTKVEFFGGFYWWGDSIWIPATTFSHWNNTKIICDVPAGASSGKIRLRRPNEGMVYHDFCVPFGYAGSKWYPGVGTAEGTDYPIVPFKVNVPNQAYWSIVSSANTWNTQGNAMVHLEERGPSNVSVPAFDGENTVLFAPYTFPGSPSMTFLWTDGSGHIIEADIVLNALHNWWIDAASAPVPSMIIANWATHEFGNLLGLTNLYGEKDKAKTMYGFTCWENLPEYFLDEHATDLAPEDIEGLQWIYSNGLDVNFSAYPNVGVSPLAVNFSNKTRSKFPIVSYQWDLGNGKTSSEQNPTAVFTAEGDAEFDVTFTATDVNGNSQTMKIEKAVKLNQRIAAGIYAEPTVGFGPLAVQFENKTTGDAESFLWDFGDGTTSTERNPVHTYSEAGIYSVSLTSSVTGFSNTESIAGLVEVYDDVERLGYTFLQFVAASGETWKGEGWDNAVDHDTYHTQGTTNVRGDNPWAVFTFDDGFARMVQEVRLMTDTGVEGKQGDWVTDFTVSVSMDGENFTDVGSFRKTGGGWEDFSFDPVEALFVKLTCEAGAHRWQQIGEFEVYEKIEIPDISNSVIMASDSHIANGYDAAGVKIILADADGNPVSGLRPSFFRLAASGNLNFFDIITETDEPGVYFGSFRSLAAEDKNISVRVGGKRLSSSTLHAASPVMVRFTEPELTKESLVVAEGTDTWRGEGWDNAVDGNLSTQVAAIKYNGCYGIYKFTDEGEHAILKLRVNRGNGKGYPQQLATEYRFSVSNDGVKFTELFKKITNASDWEEKLVLPVLAKFVKLELMDSQDKYRSLAEFEVYSTALIGAGPGAMAGGAVHKGNDAIPTKYALRQNYPNPFNPETMIAFDLPEQAKVTLQVYNLVGQSIKTLVSEKRVAGSHKIMWDGTDDKGMAVASGLYFYSIKAIGENNSFSQKMKMMLVR